MMGPVGGSGGWLSEKNIKNFFVPNELKSPKNNMSFFVLSIFGGWVGGLDPNMDISIFFLVFLLNPSLNGVMGNQKLQHPIFLVKTFNDQKIGQ